MARFVIAEGLLVFFIPFVVSIAACAFARRSALRGGFVSSPARERAGPGGVPLLGGPAVLVAIGLGVAVAVLTGRLSDPRLSSFLLLGIAFALIGVIDDLKGLSVWTRVGGEIAVALAVVWISPRVFASGAASSSPIASVISAAVIVAAANFFNMSDNADGVAASTGMLSFGAVAIVHGLSRAPGPSIFLAPLFICAAGALAGFFIWNRPPARLYLGDAGALPLGAWLGFAWLSLSRSDFRIAPGLQWIGLVWIAGYTLVDPLFAIGHRILRGRAPWGGGVDHPSHGLIARLGHPWRALDMITIVHAISVGIGAGVLLRLLAPAFIAVPLAGWTLLIARATAGFRAKRHGERP